MKNTINLRAGGLVLAAFMYASTAVAGTEVSVASLYAQRKAATETAAKPLPTENVDASAYFKANGLASTAGLEESRTLVFVNDLKDLPAPFQGVIKLKSDKMYCIGGVVNIGNNAIQLNGAGLRGHDPGKDFILSTVNGAVLRSSGTDVYMESVGVICGTTDTKAYDFQDLTGTKYCNLFSGSSVVDAPNIQSAGVGQISGFNTTCVEKNYWRTAEGVKVTGQMQKFTFSLNYVTGITRNAAIEFTNSANVSDIIIQTSYFVYSGDQGIKVNSGAIVDQGRLSLNLFRGVANPMVGFNSFTPGWEMMGNGAGIPDSKGAGFVYMNENTAPTGFKNVQLFTKINGTTKTLKSNKFTTPSPNKFIFTGKRSTTLNVFGSISAVASSTEDGNSYSIAVMKNGTEVVLPNASVSNIGRGQGFQLSLQTQVEMVSGDYIELFLKNNNNTTPIVVTDMLFKVSE